MMVKRSPRGWRLSEILGNDEHGPETLFFLTWLVLFEASELYAEP